MGGVRTCGEVDLHMVVPLSVTEEKSFHARLQHVAGYVARLGHHVTVTAKIPVLALAKRILASRLVRRAPSKREKPASESIVVSGPIEPQGIVVRQRAHVGKIIRVEHLFPDGCVGTVGRYRNPGDPCSPVA